MIAPSITVAPVQEGGDRRGLAPCSGSCPAPSGRNASDPEKLSFTGPSDGMTAGQKKQPGPEKRGHYRTLPKRGPAEAPPRTRARFPGVLMLPTLTPAAGMAMMSAGSIRPTSVDGGTTMLCRVVGFVTAALVLTVAAGPALAEVKTMEITIKSGDEEIKAFVAEPEGKGPFPGLVVIQEWWGLVDWIKDNAKRMAENGYVAVAPDLYRGKSTDDPTVARQLLTGLPRDRALRDLKAAVSYLTSKDNVNKEKIGSIGWCMGGGYSLQLALNDDRVKACVMCYGAVVTDANMLKPLNAVVLGVFGEEDMGIKAADVKKFETALKDGGKKTEEIKLYKAGHGFMRPKNGAAANPEYREAEAKAAWEAIDMFFAKTLQGK